MSDPSLMLLIVLGSLLILLILMFLPLSILFVRSQNRSQQLLSQSQTVATTTVLHLLRDQVTENQSLRNQLRAQSVPDLLGLQHATLPSESTASNEQGSDPIDLSEAVAYEEQMAKQGYTLGDIGDLESSGWASPIIRTDGTGDPVAFDSL